MFFNFHAWFLLILPTVGITVFVTVLFRDYLRDDSPPRKKKMKLHSLDGDMLVEIDEPIPASASDVNCGLDAPVISYRVVNLM